ncbi:hypothetical protein BsWGS_23760 [Bradybaena similaris]
MMPVVYFLALLIPSVSGSCNLGWLEYEDSCYSFNREKVSWFEAAAVCLVYESRLVQVESAEENAWLATKLSDANIEDAWLGGTARLHIPVWEWVPSFRQVGGGEEKSGLLENAWNRVSSKLPDWVPGSRPPTTYLNWADGEPNNQGDNGEDCLKISSYLNYQWNDVSCLDTQSFICEKDA